MTDSPEQGRIAGQVAMSYMMAIAGEFLRRFPIDFLDLLLITTIANINVSAPPAQPLRRGRKRTETPAPERTGISRNAVSRLLNVPLETVRRRVGGLIEKGVLVEQSDGLVFSQQNPMGLGNNADIASFNLGLLRKLFRDLKTAGIDLD
jgi:hypothetical protein